jgi:hypothetical protein
VCAHPCRSEDGGKNGWSAGSAGVRSPLHRGQRPWYESIPSLYGHRSSEALASLAVTGDQGGEVQVVDGRCGDLLDFIVDSWGGGGDASQGVGGLEWGWVAEGPDLVVAGVVMCGLGGTFPSTLSLIRLSSVWIGLMVSMIRLKSCATSEGGSPGRGRV